MSPYEVDLICNQFYRNIDDKMKTPEYIGITKYMLYDKGFTIPTISIINI